jgi:hypothetical protein
MLLLLDWFNRSKCNFFSRCRLTVVIAKKLKNQHSEKLSHHAMIMESRGQFKAKRSWMPEMSSACGSFIFHIAELNIVICEYSSFLNLESIY